MRRLAPAAPAHCPLPLKRASGVTMLNLAKRQSPMPRFTASISMRPSFLPRSSKSSTTTSSAGTVVGDLSSSDSTVSASLLGSASRASRA